ncbi:hypothetical protein Leryth_006219, partial [Lithospermum erythrorhizon]
GEFPPKKKQRSDFELTPIEIDAKEQTLISDVQPELPEVQSNEADCGGELPPKNKKRSDFEVTPVVSDAKDQTLVDVQRQQPEVQPDQAGCPPQKKQRSDFEATPTVSDPLNQTLVCDVQPQQPEVQSEQDLVHQADDVIVPKVEETVTPSTAKTASKSNSKKSKKKNNNVWTRPTSRKGKKKTKGNQNNGNHSNGNNTNNNAAEEKVFISPVPKFPDKNDDNPEASICLSKFYKAEKVEISEDRLSAGSTKGYRMVRATRGVVEGAWYFEIKVMHLGETGHTRLGWSTEKGDLQAPVGFDGNSFGYRDIDGSKVHKALREEYGMEGYGEGDVLGFYINLPDGSSFAPKPPRYVWFKGQRYVCAPDVKEDPPKVVPGSEICFFKNGISQGTAFTDLLGGRYFPAASMYTLPNQSNCLVKFNFGPDFDNFPGEFGERPVPRPMIEVPYHGCDGRVENGSGSLWNSTRTSTMLKVTKEQGTLFVEASELDID